MKDHITKEIQENIAVTTELARSCSTQIAEAATLIVKCLRAGRKLLAFGNGGSATEAQHLVAELVGRYRADRQPLAAMALTSDSASITSIGNDYGFEQIFARQLQAIAKTGDIAVAISTSGNSPNVVNAVESARSLGLFTIGLTGNTEGKLADLVQLCLKVPSDCTARIQEAHTLIVHLLCGLVDNAYLNASEVKPQLKSTAGEVR